MRTALALSPHLDDAAFSAGATLARLARHGWRVVVATVFTGNVDHPQGFALACQLDKGLPPTADYMGLRRAEDEAACEALNAQPRHLPLLEAPHRGYDSPAALFGGELPGDAAGAAVAEALGELLRDLAPDLVLAPRCVGGHVDHVIVRRALSTLARPLTLWWTDWPYASRPAPQDPFAVDDAGLRRVRVPAAPYQAAKIDACTAYATQIGYQFGGGEGLRASIHAVREELFAAEPAPA